MRFQVDRSMAQRQGQRRRRRLVRGKSAAAQAARDVEAAGGDLGSAVESATSTASGALEALEALEVDAEKGMSDRYHRKSVGKAKENGGFSWGFMGLTLW